MFKNVILQWGELPHAISMFCAFLTVLFPSVILLTVSENTDCLKDITELFCTILHVTVMVYAISTGNYAHHPHSMQPHPVIIYNHLIMHK